MDKPYDAIKQIATMKDPCLVLFSTGRDSICMLDLMIKYYKGPMTFVFLYFVPDLEYKNKLIRYYEKRYNIHIEQRPSMTTLSLLMGKQVKQREVLKNLRKEFNISYIAMGTRQSESFRRYSFLKDLHGVDERNHYFYPLLKWNDSQVKSYLTLNKLPVGEEYSYGFKHDLNIPTGRGLNLIRSQYPNDYKKIIETFPHLEAGIKRIEFME